MWSKHKEKKRRGRSHSSGETVVRTTIQVCDDSDVGKFEAKEAMAIVKVTAENIRNRLHVQSQKPQRHSLIKKYS